MSKIKSVSAREILNSRGQPAVESTVILDNDTAASASCPSGKSVSSYEAVELLDQDPTKFGGKGVSKAVSNVNTILSQAITGMDVLSQSEIDRKMIEADGTPNKSKLGANAILSVSIAVAKAAAKSTKTPLYAYLRQYISAPNTAKFPTPAFNILNGGKHASGNIDFQEIMIIPATSKTFSQGLEIGAAIYSALQATLKAANYTTLVGDEGGFAPTLPTNKDALLLVKDAIAKTPFQYGFDVFFGIDAAANSFYSEKRYLIKDKKTALTASDLVNYYEELHSVFHLLYLEDPLSEDDWDGWKEACAKLSKTMIIVGDDLVSTNPSRLQEAISKKAVTAIIVKPNQIGTVIEALAVVEVAKQAGLKIIVSHRSGETNDDFIADFAVGVGADYAKFGAPARGERVAKYNRLLQIEKEMRT